MSDVKYGLIVAFTENLGDDIQSLAALQFLPRVDYIIHREYMAKYMNMIKNEREVKVIMNGWFMHLPSNWYIAKNTRPLFISFHYAYRELPSRIKRDLKSHEPVGARDLYTRKLLMREGIKSYFSGCLTLTLDYGFSELRNYDSLLRSKPIVLVDVPPHIASVVKYLWKDAIVLSHHLLKYNVVDKAILRITRLICKLISSLSGHEIADEVWKRVLIFLNLHKGMKVDLKYRFVKALSHLYLYANARCVITTRLHAALPAIAFGTPTLLLVKNPKDPRYSGLIKFIDHIEIEKRAHLLYIIKKLKEFIETSESTQVRNVSELEELKRNMINTVRNFIEKA